MEDIPEELLKLSLAIVTDGGGERKLKERKISNSLLSLNSYEGYEGKVFWLLQKREEMIKEGQKEKLAVAENGNGNGNGVHLIHLLFLTAKEVEDSNVDMAFDNLTELYQNVSVSGGSVQRVAAYFADALTARLLTRNSPFYDILSKEPTYEAEFQAFTDLYRVSPYYQFAHFTANQAIIEAFESEEHWNSGALHVIDFDVSYGFQWPSLIQSLSEKASGVNKISLKITGFGANIQQLQETQLRLVNFAKGFRNLIFEFEGLIRGSRVAGCIRRKKNETLAANLVFHLNTLENYSSISDTLRFVHTLFPSVVVLVEHEGSRKSPRTFLPRFMESLHYFAAMFDSLDDCLPLDSTDRLGIEKNLLRKQIKNTLNNTDTNSSNCTAKHEKMETWKGKMKNHGYAGVKLSSKSIIQAKLLLKIRTQHCPIQIDKGAGGFKVTERDDGRALSLGWRDTFLLTASTWHCI